MSCVSDVTNRNVLPQLRVHVAPVGYEYDRVIKPALEMQADKIYLLYKREEPGIADTNWPFVERIRDFLVDHNFTVGSDLILVQTNIFDLYACMVTIAGIFGEEQKTNHQIFFNVSSGGRIPSFAGLLACMYFGGTPYYCHPETWDYLEGRSTPLTSGMKKWELVPAQAIDRPTSDLVHFLHEIDKYLTRKSTARGVSKRACADILAGQDPDATRKNKSRTAKEFNRVARLLDKLLHLHYIQFVGEGRKKVVPTPEGKNAVKIFEEFDNAKGS